MMFMMIANVIILTHTITAHHHSHDDYQSIGHCNDTCCHGDIDDCPLTDIYVTPCKCNRTFLPNTCDYEMSPCFSTLLSYDLIPQIHDDVGLPFRQKPYLLSYHAEYLSQSLGLRAPPFAL